MFGCFLVPVEVNKLLLGNLPKFLLMVFKLLMRVEGVSNIWSTAIRTFTFSSVVSVRSRWRCCQSSLLKLPLCFIFRGIVCPRRIFFALFANLLRLKRFHCRPDSCPLGMLFLSRCGWWLLWTCKIVLRSLHFILFFLYKWQCSRKEGCFHLWSFLGVKDWFGLY